ncbi:MAG: mannonate dehydratase [Ginsengibacter sp.]
MKDNRREFIKKSTSVAALITAGGLSAYSAVKSKNVAGDPLPGKEVQWPIAERPDTPKLCIGVSMNADVNEMRQTKQMGADYVLMGGPEIPWTVEGLRSIMDRFKAEGLTVINMMIGGHPNSIYGQQGRDEEIEKIQQSLEAAGKAGLPVVEYNFYAHRLMEGYYETKARGGAGNTAFDYDRGKDLPADTSIGKLQTAEMLWDNLTYFLKAVIPVAEKAGVRMALHPNDPPIPVSHGHAQIIATFKDWKRLIDIVNSPSNGMTFDCGVSREMGEDPLEVLHYLGSRDRINHVHYRNVIVDKPYVKYQEVFPDEGQVNLFAVMRELIKIKYNHGLYPEHPRAMDYDKEHPGGIQNQYPGGGGYAAQAYNFAFARAMELAVLSG